MSALMIYGAYGYSGRQIAESAGKRGLRPRLQSVSEQSQFSHYVEDPVMCSARGPG